MLKGIEYLEYDTGVFDRSHGNTYFLLQMLRFSLVPFTCESVLRFKRRHTINALRMWAPFFLGLQIVLAPFGIRLQKAGWRRVEYRYDGYLCFDLPDEVKKRLEALESKHAKAFIDELYSVTRLTDECYLKFLVFEWDAVEYYVALWNEKTHEVSPRCDKTRHAIACP